MRVQYRRLDVAAKIRQATGRSVQKGLDAISEASSQKITLQALSPGEGKVVTILPLNAEAHAHEDIAFQGTPSNLSLLIPCPSSTLTLIYIRRSTLPSAASSPCAGRTARFPRTRRTS